MSTSAGVSAKRKKALRQFGLISFVMLLIVAIFCGIYQGFFRLPSQTISEETQTVLQEIAVLTEDTDVQSITVNLEDYSGSFTIEDGIITSTDYNHFGVKLIQTVYYTFSCFILLLALWALVLLLVQHLSKVRF